MGSAAPCRWRFPADTAIASLTPNPATVSSAAQWSRSPARVLNRALGGGQLSRLSQTAERRADLVLEPRLIYASVVVGMTPRNWNVQVVNGAVNVERQQPARDGAPRRPRSRRSIRRRCRSPTRSRRTINGTASPPAAHACSSRRPLYDGGGRHRGDHCDRDSVRSAWSRHGSPQLSVQVLNPRDRAQHGTLVVR